MADQPARALIVYGDGLMRHVQPWHSHLHALAAAGSCGFLALRSPDNRQQLGDDVERLVAELAQLLDLHDIFQKNALASTFLDSEVVVEEQIPSMSERFMGVRAGMLTNSGPAAAVGKQAGFSLVKLEDGDPVYDGNRLPNPAVQARRLVTLLDLEEVGVDHDQSNFELLLLHLYAGQKGIELDETFKQQVDWLNDLIGAIQAMAQPGTKAGNHLYLVLVLGYGNADYCNGDLPGNEEVPFLSGNEELSPRLAQLVPQQSYMMKDCQPATNIRNHHPLLVISHLNAVTRQDEVKMLDYNDFQNHCGNLNILADRLLHEVAFKLWKAPKYGA